MPLSQKKRSEMEAEIKRHLVRGGLGGADLEAIALRFHVSERSVYKARRRVLDRLILQNPIDRRRERMVTLLMLDNYTTAAASAGKYRDALQGLKLRVELLGLKEGLEETQGGGVGARTVDELLETIAEAEALKERLSAPVVHEDDEE